MIDDKSMLIEFIAKYAHHGAHWLAEESGHKYSTIVNLAHRHRISLKTKNDNRGRKLKPVVMPTNRVTKLNSDHPIVIAIWERKSYMGKQVLGTSQWKRQRIRVLQRDNYQCQYCGLDATEVDHVIPRTAGGGHEMDNLLACCKKCNGLKGARSQKAFLESLSTPLDFAGNLSPMRSEVPQNNPFKSLPKPN